MLILPLTYLLYTLFFFFSIRIFQFWYIWTAKRIDEAKEMGDGAVLVEGEAGNYHSHGFLSSDRFGIEAGPGIRLPHTVA